MSVEDVRDALAAARAAQQEALDERVRRDAALRRTSRDLGAAVRAGDDAAAEEARARLERAQGELGEAHRELQGARERVAEALQAGEAVTDPRRLVGRWRGDVPALLLPMRLETRFRSVASVEGEPGEQLWVRVFPDACSVDAFVPELTEAEVADGQRFWLRVWAAAGDAEGQRAAWRALVSGHGTGRAHWVVDSYAPSNPSDAPVRTVPEEVFLVLPAVPSGEQAAVRAFWEAFWRAGDDASAREAAADALSAAVGADRGGEIVAASPVGLDAEPFPPATRATAPVSVVLLELPPVPDAVPAGWTRAPRAALLPDRFVLVLESGETRREVLGRPVPPVVHTGPDPLAPQPEQVHAVDGRLELPDELAWLADFDRAVADGLGFVVNLDGAEARRGFDRVYALGVRALAEPEESGEELATLLRHHHYTRAGVALVPQGTPTNNTEDAGAGFTRTDDLDTPLPTPLLGSPALPADGSAGGTDGDVLTRLLGLDADTLRDVPHAGGTDQRDARAMQTLLWPATFGYLLGTLLDPLVEDHTEQARRFFAAHVRGRGALPAVRVGAQPYGVLATTAFTRVERGSPPAPPRDLFPGRLHGVLEELAEDWDGLVGGVASLGRGGKPVSDRHETLLGVLGLHPTSAEFHYRYAETFEQLLNKAHLGGFAGALYTAVLGAALDAPARALLTRLGWDGQERPPLMDLFFDAGQGPLTGPLVDDRPLSGTEPVRDWTTDGRSYVEWLRDAATTSLDALRSNAAFPQGKAPTALLFLLARHALTLGYAESARGLYRLADAPSEVLRAMRREPPYVHVTPDGPSESRFAALYRHDTVISPGESWTVAAEVSHVLPTSPATQVLREQVEALDVLAQVPTASLERLLVEHLDTCAYRLDAWRLGLVHQQLEQMREAAPEGLHLGAWGWLEAVRPKRGRLEPVVLPEDLAAVFGDDPPLVRDPASGGHLLASSLNQAVTASVLRSAYLSDASPEDPDAMAVNLSSQRVRRALEILDGMRSGQSLGALLGYQLERGLHDRSGLAEVDVFVFALRRAFPLRADHLRATAADPGVPIEALEARNVVDGLALVQHVEETDATAYPFGLTGLPPASEAQRQALAAEVDALRDARDAVGDLALAESVHQASQASAERAAATLRAFESGHRPPESEVVRTPASGTTLTHRAGLHLDLGAAPGTTPRSTLCPPLDAWLAAVLPPLGDVGCVVSWADPVDATAHEATVTLADLGLRPLDVLELLRADEPAMAELDDRVLLHVRRTAAPRPDTLLLISYLASGTTAVPMFEVAALVGHLRALVAGARPLRASDVVPPGEASHDLDAGAVVDLAPLTAVGATLAALRTDVASYLATWTPRLDDPATLPPDTDTAVDDAVDLLERGARLAVPGAGWGQALAARQGQYARLVARLRERAVEWTVRLAGADAALAAYDALPAATPAADRLAALAAIESMLAPALSDQDPDPAVQRVAVGARRDAFEGRRDALLAVSEGSAAGLAALRGDVLGLLPVDDVDSAPFALEDTDRAMVVLVEDVVAGVAALGAELARREVAAQAAADAATAATDAPARVEARQAQAEALLGEGVRLLPTFSVPGPAAAEWSASLGSSDLLSYVTVDLGTDLPVEDWLHSVARVRTPMRHLEQAGLLAEALGGPDLLPAPAQLPHRPGDRWLALEHPPDADLSGEHLLYTALYPSGFDPAGSMSGLLLDEWTEVLPAVEATAGLAFHYDRPSSEAPQAMLLVAPASSTEAWTWEDLRQALPDTLALARSRAVEPEHLAAGAVARFLPATVSAVTRYGISISLALAENNDVLELMEP